MNSPLLQSLFEEDSGDEQFPLSVSELNEMVKGDLESRYANVWLEGEISNFFKAASGHWYFSLTDSDSQIKAACFKSTNWRIRFEPKDGLSVRVRGRLSVYVPRGEYQITVESLEPVGEGAMKLAFEQVKAKLEADGLFDEAHKRALPYFPQRIGVVTSANGAAFFDILNVLARRTKSVSIVLIPTLVQGESAPREIRKGIELANSYNKKAPNDRKIDVLIVGRGGGSSEDLAAFNEEFVARAIFESEIPVISAVGHEIDFSIADMVADVRAPTPSAAAEIVAAHEDHIEETIERRIDEMERILDYKLLSLWNHLQSLDHSTAFSGFTAELRDRKYEIADLLMRAIEAQKEKVANGFSAIDDYISRISPIRLATRFAERKSKFAVLEERTMSAAAKIISKNEKELGVAMASLDAMSPLSVLERGYSLSTDSENKIIRDASNTSIGEIIKVRFARGSLKAEITEKE